MRCNQVSGDARISSVSRSSKKTKKTRRKASSKLRNKRPVLLLHKLREAPGPRVRKKTCTVCKELKWLSDFYISRNSRGGSAYKSECKKCDNERNYKLKKKKRETPVIKIDPLKREYFRRYYYANKDKFLEYRKKFLERNPEYFVLKSRARRERLQKESAEAKEALRDKDCL